VNQSEDIRNHIRHKSYRHDHYLRPVAITVWNVIERRFGENVKWPKIELIKGDTKCILLKWKNKKKIDEFSCYIHTDTIEFLRSCDDGDQYVKLKSNEGEDMIAKQLQLVTKNTGWMIDKPIEDIGVRIAVFLITIMLFAPIGLAVKYFLGY